MRAPPAMPRSKPGDHEAEGADGRAEQQGVLRDGDDGAEAERVADDGGAADPERQHGDDVERKDHQGLIPGGEAQGAELKVAETAVLRVEAGDLVVFAGEGHHDATPVEALLHDRAENAGLLLHAVPHGAHAPADDAGEDDQNGHAEQDDDGEAPVEHGRG